MNYDPSWILARILQANSLLNFNKTARSIYTKYQKKKINQAERNMYLDEIIARAERSQEQLKQEYKQNKQIIIPNQEIKKTLEKYIDNGAEIAINITRKYRINIMDNSNIKDAFFNSRCGYNAFKQNNLEISNIYYSSAINCFTAEGIEAPSYLYLNQGVCLLILGQVDEAKNMLDIVIDRNDEYIEKALTLKRILGEIKKD